MNLITKIKSIVQGKYRTLTTPREKIPEWVQKRRDICSKCPFNSKHTPIHKRGFRWYKWKVLNNFKNFCTLCGCGINPLTFSELTECEIKKWKSIEQEE